MVQNVGSIDKVIRVVVGLGLLSLLFLVEGSARWWGLIGIVPILTVVMGWCPAYALLGLSTHATKKS
ncbi:MAG TPA: DUF2892 domain-containing protein [Candidatus Methylomirabilis sp.]|nr:DUF2892 domain-containing protein [Candidatus Methylomirabilis sp.]